MKLNKLICCFLGLLFVASTCFAQMYMVTDLGTLGGSLSVAYAINASGQGRPYLPSQGKILQNYGKLPLSFEANQGQADARVKFLSRGSSYALFLTSDEAVFNLHGSKSKDDASDTTPQLRSSPTVPTTNAVLRMKLVKANPAAKVTGTDELAGTSNYFIGNDPKKWRTQIANYKKVRYQRVYPGVDLVYHGNQRQLEYDFVVAPGADPSRIRLKFRGAGTLRIDDKGDLVLGADEDEVRLQKPQVYQEASGTRKAVEGRYSMEGANTISFRVADYDRSKPLVIDPVLVYSTYLGSSNDDVGNAITVDASGNAYVTGVTTSSDFPTTPGAFQTSYRGVIRDTFVTKLNSTGSSLVYSTYLGGSNDNLVRGVAVNASGDAYVTGLTTSPDFPTTPGAFQTMCGGGSCVGYDAFVTKLNPTGSALVYSTYLGGSSSNYGNGIAVDASGNAYVTGSTNSTDFPTTPAAFQTVCGACTGNTDAFVTKLNPTGSALVYSTYLGGSGGDNGSGIAVDSAGNAYLIGGTNSTNFPTMNPFEPANAAGYDAFVAKIAPIIPYQGFVQQPINSDGSSIFSAKRGVVPVKFTLTQNGVPTCTLPPATIAVTRTAGGTLGSVEESIYSMQADTGSNFRIDQTACQYVYNLAASSLGVGTYQVDISINRIVVGHAVFALQ